jgi:nucleoid DNA-binding protein
MDKRQFSKRLAERCGTSDLEASAIIEDFVSVVREALSEGDEVWVDKLCRFYPEWRAPFVKAMPSGPGTTGELKHIKGKFKIRCAVYPSVGESVNKVLAGDGEN